MRKLFFNVGFQFNYAQPFALSNFYNATYYQNIFNSRDFKGENHRLSQINTANGDILQNNTFLDPSDSFVEEHMQSRSIAEEQNELVGSDLTAAQLYSSIEDNFIE